MGLCFLFPYFLLNAALNFLSAGGFCCTVVCVLGVGNSCLSMCVFRKALVAMLEFRTFFKECKYSYQLISGKAQRITYLLISLKDGKHSYQLSSAQACWHSLSEEEHLCVQVMLPSHCHPLLCFRSCGLSLISATDHCWNLSSLQGLDFPF